ncbi:MULTISPECIES: hypothetical protein [unclassified Rhizobium]|uniref:hypothetical protein n=1 Tax=unclassified Rhizobium TaxID=2613769 RepID=UPI001ADBE2CF|nr:MULTISPECIES: hypothetical protein [unclassified Rhizobium]MBO9099982.1 hypothetical protein [Rhizobium sp. L58/93]QXZ82793.1 hypothetical protein J5287_11955 [Rhizobium sp. K1/93]QXZ89694.1 hypothetical protein J5280_16635 [Rhizobium sp. K15/93]
MTQSSAHVAGARSAIVVEAALSAGIFVETEAYHRRVCVRLNVKGFLRRDGQRADTWYPSEKLLGMYPGRDTPSLAVSVPVFPDDILPTLHTPDASMLATTIQRARALFSEGDYEAALYLAEGAYDQAKAAANYGKRMRASEQLIAKAHELQADALRIEWQAKAVLADHFDDAQKAGLVAVPGRPKKVSNENLLRLEDVGLTKARIHEARKIRDAEKKSPGISERAIQARLMAGLEPSRANLRAAIGTASASKDDRGANFYQTPPEATRTLLAFESFTSVIWEPACGLAAISAVLEDQGYDVQLSDLHARGATDRYGEIQATGDFLHSRRSGDEDGPDIVTNPPYGEALNDFVAHALREHRPRKMALLLNLNFLCGFADDERNFVMDENPPARVYVFKRRLPMMHREGWDGKKASSRMNTAWFVWERQEDGTYGSATTMIRVDWSNFVDADARPPGDLGHGAAAYFVEGASELPRKTLDERISEERERATLWIAGRQSFSRPEMRRGLGVRDAVAEALIAELVLNGEISAVDDDGQYAVIVTAEMEAA